VTHREYAGVLEIADLENGVGITGPTRQAEAAGQLLDLQQVDRELLVFGSLIRHRTRALFGGTAVSVGR
jgi:hypothetical protein